jgi:hypothetical protein
MKVGDRVRYIGKAQPDYMKRTRAGTVTRICGNGNASVLWDDFLMSRRIRIYPTDKLELLPKSD